MNRRTFLKTMLTGGVLFGISRTGLSDIVGRGLTKITILHTNDIHSQIEPFPSNHHRFPGMGGFARRAALIKKIRQEEKNVLLFDAGDIFMGTPYFNFYKGKLDIKLMSEMGYTAATLGNHEFNNGLEGILMNLPYANFPFISSNYDFSDTILKGKISKYEIFEIENVKVGVFGLGIELKGLVSKSSYENTLYLDPVRIAAQMSHFLKKDMNCDLVICLSHLGYNYKDDKISDLAIAKQSKNIDVIIGGHSHTTLQNAVVVLNSDRKEVVIGQAGFAGVHLGRIDLYLKKNTSFKFAEANTIKVLNKQG